MHARRLLRAVPARLCLAASLSLAAGAAPAQSYFDVGGTHIQAFALMDGCVASGACAGPNSATNPEFVAVVSGGGGGGANGSVGTVGSSAPSSATLFGAINGAGNLADLILNADSGLEVHVMNSISGFALESGGNLAQVASDVGPPGATACASDTGACNLNALAQRIAQRLTSAIAALGSPLQAGGAVTTTATNPATIASGQQTATLSAAPLPSQALTNGVVIKALSTNTGTVYVGPAGVTTSTGYPLKAGEAISYAVTNLSAVSIIGQNTSDALAFTGN